MMGLTPLILLALGFPPPVETQTFELKFCEPPTPELFRRAHVQFWFKTELELNPSGRVHSLQSTFKYFEGLIETPEECFLSWRFPSGASRPSKATIYTYWNTYGGWWLQSVLFGEVQIRLMLTEPEYLKNLGVNRLEFLEKMGTHDFIRKLGTFLLEFCRPSVPLFSRWFRDTFRFQTELVLDPSGKVQLVGTRKQDFPDIIQTPEECFLNWRFPSGASQPKNASVTTDWHVDGGWKLQSVQFGRVIVRLRPYESEYLKGFRRK